MVPPQGFLSEHPSLWNVSLSLCLVKGRKHEPSLLAKGGRTRVNQACVLNMRPIGKNWKYRHPSGALSMLYVSQGRAESLLPAAGTVAGDRQAVLLCPARSLPPYLSPSFLVRVNL